MSSTNKTAELQLSQFVGTDIPSILTDYNGDMRKIDAGVLEVKQATAGAVSDLSSVTARVTNAEQSISGLNSTVQGIATRVVTAEGDIDALQTSVGNLETAVNTKADASAVTALQGDVDTIEGVVNNINAVIPSNASTSNKLATMADVGSNWRLVLDDVEISAIATNTSVQTAIANFMTTYANRIATGEIVAKAFVGSLADNGDLSYKEYNFGLQRTPSGNFGIDLDLISAHFQGIDVEGIQVQGPNGHWEYTNYLTTVRTDSITVTQLGTGNTRNLSIFISE